MAAVTTAIIGATVAAGSLAYSISNSQQQNKIAQQARDKAQGDADNQLATANAKATQEQATSDRNAALSNERRRVVAPAVSTPTSTSAPSTSLIGSSTGAAAPSSSPATVTRGSGTLLGA